MNDVRSVRRTFVTVLVTAVLPALMLGASIPVQVKFLQVPGPAVLAGDDTKTGGGPG